MEDVDRQGMVDWKDLKKRLDDEANKIVSEEPIDIKRLLSGIFPYTVGVDGQYFTAICGCYSTLFGLGHTYLPNLMFRALQDPDFTVEQCKKMFKYSHALNDLLGFFGMEKIHTFTNELFKAFDSVNTKEEMTELMSSYFKYASKLFSWMQIAFPWGLGHSMYRIRDPEEIKEIVKDLEEIKASYGASPKQRSTT